MGFLRCSLVLVLLWSLVAEALGAVYIDALELELRLSPRGGKPYNQFLGALRQKGLVYDLQVLPLGRLVRKVDQLEGRCVFPIAEAFLRSGYFSRRVHRRNFVSGEVVDYVSLRVFSAAGEALISNVEELRGKRIAYRDGDDIDVFVPDVGAIEVKTEGYRSRFKMLYAGRLDAIVGYIPDVPMAARQFGFPELHYNPELNLLGRREGVSIVCHASNENRAFIERFNTLLRAMKSSGELRELLGADAVIEAALQRNGHSAVAGC